MTSHQARNFLGEAASQVSMGRYNEEAVCAKISGLSDRKRMLKNPILLIDDVCFTGRKLKRTKDLLKDRFKAKEVYTAALFKQAEMPAMEEFPPDLKALNMKANTSSLGSNWQLARVHTTHTQPYYGTGEFRQTPQRLKEIFEEDLPHDLELLSQEVLLRLQKRRVPLQEQYRLQTKIASAA